MSKAEKTKENIVKQAAALFNQKGYSGSSISDIMQATGLQGVGECVMLKNLKLK